MAKTMNALAPMLPRPALGWSAQAAYWRDLLLELAARDVKIQYKRSSLGIFWSLANPLFQFFVFSFVFAQVLSVKIPRYSAYAFSGLLIWTWFQTALAQGVRAMTSNRELVKRPGFPTPILPVVSVVVPWVHFIWALPVLFVFLLVNQAPMSWTVLLLPMVMLVQGVISLSLIYLLAAVNVVFRDVQHILGVVLQVMLFATPVFYEARAIPEKYRLIYILNPLAQLIESYRAILLYGTWPDFQTLAILGGAGLVILVGALQLFIRMSHRFAEEL